jgi:biotin carboxylase
MKKRVLILGAGPMQAVAINAAHDRGWEVVAVDGNPNAPARPLADLFEPIDLKDRAGLASLAARLAAEGGLDGVFTAATDFSASVAHVAEAAGLPGHRLEAALNASDKLRMRARFREAGVPSPRFVGVDAGSASRLDALMEGEGIAFPIVVKPVDNMGARGCRRVDRATDAPAALADAIRYSRSGQAIVEEYMEGPEFSIEALVFDGKVHLTGLADRHIFFPPYFVEMGHTMPTEFPAEDRAALVRVFEAGIRALGLTHGAAKGDVKLTPRGPMIGEIAGRLSGGYMSGWTFPYAYGIDLTGSALELAVGLRPRSLAPTHEWVSAERAWISIPGIVSAVHGLERARALPWMRDVFPRVRPGDEVRFPENNVEKCGNCLSAAPVRSDAVRAAEEGARAVVVRLTPHNPRTDAFLAEGPLGAESFPPDAYEIPGLARGELKRAGLVSGPEGWLLPTPILAALDGPLDWQGRTIAESLAQAVSLEPGLGSRLRDPAFASAAAPALIRGGIQGILYLYDSGNP